MQAALAASGKKQADLVIATGAKASSVTNWIGGRTSNLKGENLSRAASCLGVSPVWLAAGIGEMKSDTAWPFTKFSQADYEALAPEVRLAIESWVANQIAAFAPVVNPKKISPAAKAAGSR
jgi:transcriptional regulator with XRE-family HTH domain